MQTPFRSKENMKNKLQLIRRKIGLFIVKLGNKILDEEYYDFGSEIIATNVWKDNLIVATKNSLFGTNNNKTWKNLR